MSELYDQIVGQRGTLENIVARIPGFKGYQDKQARRTADRMIREHLAKLIQQRHDRFVRIEKLILSNGGLKYMTRTRNAKSVLQRYRDNIELAMPKYDGMWAQMKIGSEELEKIYAFDEAQMRYLDKIDGVLDEMENSASGEGLDSAIMNFETTLHEAIDAFALRDDVLTNLNQDE